MKSKWTRRLMVVAAAVALVVVLRLTYCAPKPVPVSVYRVAKGRVEQTVTNAKSGSVKARMRAKLSPEIGGRVVEVGAREGQRVKAGDLIVRLEDSEYRAALDLAERATKAGVAAREEACMVAELAGRELERNRELSRQGIISESMLDQFENAREAADARCRATGAEVERLEAAVEVARSTLRKTVLVAPFDGVVVDLTAEIGEWVSPSPPAVPIPPVADILGAGSVYVEAPIDEVDAGRLAIDQQVRIRLDPFPDESFPGRLTRIAPFVRDIEGQNRTVDVEAELDDAQAARRLLPGTSADIEVILDARDAVLRIPAHALLEGNKVLLVEGKKLVAKSVTPGLRNWEFVQVSSGLAEGELIAVSLDRPEVKDGALVEVSEEVRK